MTEDHTPKSFLAELVSRFNNLWSKGGVKLTVNGRAPEVLLPQSVIDEHPPKIVTLSQADGSTTKTTMTVIMLHYPLHPVVPISDLKIDTSGISATLSFNRTPHKTFIPWTAVLGLTALYDEPDGEPTPAQPPKRGHLRAVP